MLQHRGTLNHEEGALKDGIDKTKEVASQAADKTIEVASAAADKTKEVAAATADKTQEVSMVLLKNAQRWSDYVLSGISMTNAGVSSQDSCLLFCNLAVFCADWCDWCVHMATAQLAAMTKEAVPKIRLDWEGSEGKPKEN